jgi:homoserine O-acetyltransferase
MEHHNKGGETMNMFLRAVVLISILSIVGAGAWAHTPEHPAHQVAELGSFTLESGAVIDNLRMSYVTHGKLNEAKDNAILFMHGFGANHHLVDHLVGPGKGLDTTKYFIIAADSFGNTQGNFEHSTSPTNSGLKMDFPAYNVRDMVNAEYKLVKEGLGIDHLLAVTGISMGGQKTIQFGVSYPDFMDGLMPIVGSAKWSSEFQFFTLPYMLKIVEHCDGWANGNYETNPKACATASLSGLIPSFYTRDWWNEHITSADAYTKWRSFWDQIYLGIQDTRDLYYLTKAMASTTVADTPGHEGKLESALGAIQATTLFIIAPQDEFLPPAYIDMQRELIPRAEILAINSSAGHLVCCGVDPKATEVLNTGLARFLTTLAAGK